MMANVLISFISGIALSFAFPRANLYPLAWFAVTPLFYLLQRRGWGMTGLIGLAFGLGFFGSLLSWIAIFGKLPWVALTVFQSLFIVAFALSAKLVGGRLGAWGRLVLLPTLWVGFEWVRSVGLLGFTWGDLGYSQSTALPVIQIASSTGVWGVSFLVALSNAALASAVSEWTKSRSLKGAYTRLGLVAAIVAAAGGIGAIALRAPASESGEWIHVAVVQGNINQDTDQDLEYREKSMRVYREMTLKAASAGADLIVWPETAVPGSPGRNRFLQSWLSDLSAQAQAFLIVGGRDEDDDGHVYNSAFLVGPGEGILARYAKVRLVPFGEFVPAREYVPFLQYYRVTPMDLSAGPRHEVLTGGPCTIGLAICFESIFPYISRELTSSGAEMLCVITNDAWFGRTSAAEQHAAKSVFRAVENRRYLLRGAATGVSSIIDPYGRVLDGSPIFHRAILKARVRGMHGETFYTRHGDWFVYTSLGVAGLLAVVAALRGLGLRSSSRRRTLIAKNGIRSKLQKFRRDVRFLTRLDRAVDSKCYETDSHGQQAKNCC